MTKISIETHIRVRYGETDQMGIVYHGNYAQYLEISRIEWLEKLGFSYRKMEEDGIMLPVVNICLNYKKSAFFDEILTIKTSIKRIPNVKIEFEYEIFNEKQELLTVAETTLVFVSAKTRKPMKCPVPMLDKIKTLI